MLPASVARATRILRYKKAPPVMAGLFQINVDHLVSVSNFQAYRDGRVVTECSW